MAWRRAGSLNVLGDEVHAVSPNQTIYDIGDEAHQAEASDHNPNSAGVVCAIDIMVGNNLDMNWLAEKIRTSNHPDLKYVIWNRRIASKKYNFEWRTYTGSNPHTDHIHVSVGVGTDGHSQPPYDSPNSWGISSGGMSMLCSYGQSGPIVMALQTLLYGLGFDPGIVDGKYGNNTAAALAKALNNPNNDGKNYGPWEYAAIMCQQIRSKGPQGDPGKQGDPGPEGKAATLQPGTVLTVISNP